MPTPFLTLNSAPPAASVKTIFLDMLAMGRKSWMLDSMAATLRFLSHQSAWALASSETVYMYTGGNSELCIGRRKPLCHWPPGTSAM